MRQDEIWNSRWQAVVDLVLARLVAGYRHGDAGRKVGERPEAGRADGGRRDDGGWSERGADREQR